MPTLPPYTLSEPDVLTFVLLPLALVGLFVWGVHDAWRRTGASPPGARRAAAMAAVLSAAWMMGTWVSATRGTLRDFSATPPPFAFLVLSILAIGFIVGFGTVGWRLAAGIPLWALVAVQSFRLPLELAMHRMYERGIMPQVMSYSGRNLDIVTGATAIVAAILIATHIGGRRLALAWSLLGFALLANIVTVAILATPRIQYFGPDQQNLWVTFPPFVWLPAVMVLAALIGHIVIFRACPISTSR